LERKWPRVADFGSTKKYSHVLRRNIFTRAQLIFHVLDGAPGLDTEVELMPIRELDLHSEVMLVLMLVQLRLQLWLLQRFCSGKSEGGHFVVVFVVVFFCAE